MADNNRKSITTQVSERLTPESHKTTGEKIKEKFTNMVDKVKSVVTPDSEKSLSQQAADKVRSDVDSHTTHTTHTRQY